ncbi:DEAD/DEAH box helicase family protein [Oceanospirillum sp. HFRX-1_2]
MKLRAWQKECIAHALLRFEKSPHYFCQATPAAGKTLLAAEIARRLLNQSKVDIVVCFSPSSQVVDSTQRAFEQTLGKSFDGKIGSQGIAVTYQSLGYQSPNFWRLFEDYNVFAIFDEIHHCSAGSDSMISNAWGQRVIQEVQDKAAFTLALSGTPWRSDEQAIALARYSHPDGRLIVDYQYSIQRAVAEKVCRKPSITLVDHDHVHLRDESNNEQSFSSLGQLLDSSDVTYEWLVTHEAVNKHLLLMANNQLNKGRELTPDAGALAVATSIAHAYRIESYLKELGESPVVVTTKTADANSAIDTFRKNRRRWIIAVGMIAEGTDIPRLQVCCYLSRIRTELYFRQVLGRVLRHRLKGDNSASLMLIAEPELVKFAERVDNDLPDHLSIINFQKLELPREDNVYSEGENGSCQREGGDEGGDSPETGFAELETVNPAKKLSMTFEGMFRHQLLELF